jgi:hypothetical protein
VKPEDSGLASGIVNTAFMMGGALGLAILASLAAARTGELLARGAATPVALNAGYHVAFMCGAIFAALAGLLGAAFLRARAPSAHGEAQSAHDAPKRSSNKAAAGNG